MWRPQLSQWRSAPTWPSAALLKPTTGGLGGDLMVALAGFGAGELPAARALTNATAAEHYGPLRVAATVEIDREIKVALTARGEATAAVERLIAGS